MLPMIITMNINSIKDNPTAKVRDKISNLVIRAVSRMNFTIRETENTNTATSQIITRLVGVNMILALCLVVSLVALLLNQPKSHIMEKFTVVVIAAATATITNVCISVGKARGS